MHSRSSSRGRLPALPSAFLALALVMPATLAGQAGTNYDAAQRAQDRAVASGKEAMAALQLFLSGAIPSELGSLPGSRPLAGTSPDCPATFPVLFNHESKLGVNGKEKVVFASDYRKRLIDGGFLCEPVDPRLEIIIVLGVVLQEVRNATEVEGEWTPANVRKWERLGHQKNKDFMEAMKGVPDLLPDPGSRKKLCKRIQAFCAVIRELR